MESNRRWTVKTRGRIIFQHTYQEQVAYRYICIDQFGSDSMTIVLLRCGKWCWYRTPCYIHRPSKWFDPGRVAQVLFESVMLLRQFVDIVHRVGSVRSKKLGIISTHCLREHKIQLTHIRWRACAPSTSQNSLDCQYWYDQIADSGGSLESSESSLRSDKCLQFT